MRRFIAVFVFAAAIGLVCSVAAREPALRRLATVELNRDSLVHNDSMRTVELLGPKRLNLGSYQSIRLYDIISSIPDVKSAQRASLVVVCEASDGRTCATSFAELDPAVVRMPALLLINPNTEKRNQLDSFALSDKRDAKGKVDLSVLERRFSRVTRLRYMMNDVVVSAEERSQFPNLSMRLLFPYDRSPMRWLPDIKFIHVYVAE